MSTKHTWESFLQQVEKDSAIHASIPFWSWSDRLCHKELLWQMEDMKRLGMRGFFMHARGGLETEYLSDEWFDAIRFCVEKGKELGLEAWAYDENGWPSGFGGGELLRDPSNHACGIALETCTEYPSDMTDILGVYVRQGSGVYRISMPCDASEYLIVRRYRDFSYVDVMNPAIAKQFIDVTHRRYQQELGESMGRDMPDFFTDEPQHFRYGTPWSDTFPDAFFEKYGYDVRELLLAMFLDIEGAEEFRYDYYLLCHESFYENFMKPIYQWCDQNGVKLTGHGIEEWSLAGQMMCCGGVMPLYLYEHIPGIDYLRRHVKDASGARQLGSVCEQTYLYGDFDVRSLSEFVACERNTVRTEGEFVLVPRKLDPDFGNLVQDGYPFFAGEITGKTVLCYRKGDPTRLKLGGRFAVCRLTVNDVALPVELFSDEFELAPYLREGENTLMLSLCVSNRNLLGPHHRRDPEPLFVTPKTFSYEKQWRDADCADYVPSYVFVRFGIGF